MKTLESVDGFTVETIAGTIKSNAKRVAKFVFHVERKGYYYEIRDAFSWLW